MDLGWTYDGTDYKNAYYDGEVLAFQSQWLAGELAALPGPASR